MSTRRVCFQGMPHDRHTHAGLWLDAFITDQQREDTESRRTLVDQVSGIHIPESYRTFYTTRWKPALIAQCPAIHPPQIATVQGRMVVGLGDESVLETSIRLHHTYGVPYIPGSALKGLAAHYARNCLTEEWTPDSDTFCYLSRAYTTVFGTPDHAGYLTFFDALYVPGSGVKGQVLYPDVITVHHQDYYAGKPSAPADWDSPNPVPFLSATGSYLVALAGPEAWVAATFTILGQALQTMGIGAKTSSGYGRMHLEGGPEPAQTTEPVADPDTQTVNTLIQRLTELPNQRVATELNRFVEEWRALTVSTPLKQQVAQAILDKVRDAGRETKSSGKAWYKEIKASLVEDQEQNEGH